MTNMRAGILGTAVVTTDFGYPADGAFADALPPWDGKLVVAGFSNDVRPFAVARYLP